MPTIFLGSSKEGQDLTTELTTELATRAELDVLPWYDAFNPGFGALEELAKRLNEVDFAAFFLLPDDQVRMRDQTYDVPRDNVVFELGLFMGKLNRDRTFALVEKPEPSAQPIELFTDFKGVTWIPFARTDVTALADDLIKHIRPLGPIARIPHGTHVVERGARGRNVYDTIAAALDVAEPGDVILVRPGIYSEPLMIDKPLEIIGVGVMDESDRAVVRTQGSTAVTYAAEAGHGRIATMTIEAGGSDACALDVTDGTLTVRGCSLTGRGPLEACVRVRGDAVARLDSNSICDAEGVGVLICERGGARITDNLIASHTQSCIEVRDGTQPHIYGNRVGKGRSGGLWLHGGSRGVLERNDIYEHGMAGITVTERADPQITGNRIHNGLDAGIYIGRDGRGTISENDIYANDGTGIDIDEGGEPLVVNNRIYDGVGGGIALRAGAAGRINHNLIRANQRAGVAFASGSAPSTFMRNTVIDGGAEGVYDEVGVPHGDNQILRNADEDWPGPRASD